MQHNHHQPEAKQEAGNLDTLPEYPIVTLIHIIPRNPDNQNLTVEIGLHMGHLGLSFILVIQIYIILAQIRHLASNFAVSFLNLTLFLSISFYIIYELK